VQGRAGGGQATGRRRSAALAGVLRGDEEETEGPLSAAVALPLRRQRCLAAAAAHPGRCRRCPGGDAYQATATFPSSGGAALAAVCLLGGVCSWAAGLGHSGADFFGLDEGQKKVGLF
jgi:hypothetical protein